MWSFNGRQDGKTLALKNTWGYTSAFDFKYGRKAHLFNPNKLNLNFSLCWIAHADNGEPCIPTGRIPNKRKCKKCLARQLL